MRVLLLGGTTEASMLAEMLAEDPRFTAILSLAGVTLRPVLPRIAHRIGGFGGIDGLSSWMRDQRIEALIDATHPYAVQMSHHAATAAARDNIPCLRVDRPGWTAQAGDRWIQVRDSEAAAQALETLGDTPRRVLLTLGSKGLAPFCRKPMHHYVIRCIDAPEAELLPPDHRLLLARGPFTMEDEVALLALHRIDSLVSKNSGGSATAAKLQAARQCSLPVVMIERTPRAADAPHVATAAEAMRWLSALYHEASPALA